MSFYLCRPFNTSSPVPKWG